MNWTTGPTTGAFSLHNGLMTGTMTEQHPIAPPPELMRNLWRKLSKPPHTEVEAADAWENVITAATQWGADQELEACVDVILAQPALEHPELLVELLRAARRPKPPSLKEQALKNLASLESTGEFFYDQMKDLLDTLHRALETLPK